jgi:hypothetical protein
MTAICVFFPHSNDFYQFQNTDCTAPGHVGGEVGIQLMDSLSQDFGKRITDRRSAVHSLDVGVPI